MPVRILDDTPYKGMYDHIKWEKIELKYFNAFAVLIEKDPEIKDLIKKVYNYEKGFILAGQISKDDNVKQCNDINIGFNLTCYESSGGIKKNSQIFHIALHSSKPLWVSSGCDYYTFDDSQETYIDYGPFHYKIDRVEPMCSAPTADNCKSDERKNKLTDKLFPPFKKLNYNEHCYFLPNDDKFTNDSILNLYPDCEYLHKLIYNRFIDYWNLTILPKVKITSAAAEVQPPPPPFIKPSVSLDADERRSKLATKLKLETKHEDKTEHTADIEVLAQATSELVASRDLTQLLSDLDLDLNAADDKQKYLDNSKTYIDRKSLNKQERTVLMEWALSDKKPKKKEKKAGSYRNKRLYKKSKITKKRIISKKSRRINYIK